MTSNREGGLKAARILKDRDPEWYAKIGSIGGSKKVPKGFAVMPKDKVLAAGKKGGANSNRKGIKNGMGKRR